MRVLIGTDGSDDAVAAATQALALLAPADAVTVVCVVDPPPEPHRGHGVGLLRRHRQARGDRRRLGCGRVRCRRLAATYGSDLLGTAAQVDTVVQVGSAGPEISAGWPAPQPCGRRGGRRLPWSRRHPAGAPRFGEHARAQQRPVPGTVVRAGTDGEPARPLVASAGREDPPEATTTSRPASTDRSRPAAQADVVGDETHQRR